MNDYGDIISLLLIIIISIAGSIYKWIITHLKKKHPTPTQPTPTSQPDPQLTPDGHPRPAPIIPDTHYTTTSATTPIPSPTTITTTDHHPAPHTPPITPPAPATTPTPDLSDPATARAAIIASEILNRKY